MPNIVNGLGQIKVGVKPTPPPTYLLDVYSGAAAAYSLRLLRSGYKGFAAVRVRRSSDNTSQDIGFDANGNLDTAALLSFVGAGNGYIVLWYDQSGSGNNYYLYEPTAVRQPQIVNSGSVILNNGKPSLKFSNQRIGNTIPFTNITLDSYSMFYAGYSTDTTPNIGGIVSIGNANTDMRFGVSNLLLSYWNGSYQINGNYNMNVNKLYSSIVNGNKTHTVWGNNVQLAQGTKTGTLGTPTGFAIGGIQNSSYYSSGYMNELIIYSNDQSSNRTGIQNNINTYYSIYQ
jgi:hypothetical protein